MCTGSETTSAPVSSVPWRTCPKCGVYRNSGRLSCCADGGSWFNNCGPEGDTNFGHTFLEGIQACDITEKAQSQSVFRHRTVLTQLKHYTQQQDVDSDINVISRSTIRDSVATTLLIVFVIMIINF